MGRFLEAQSHPSVFALFSVCKNRRRSGRPPRAVTFTFRLRAENRPVIASWEDGVQMRVQKTRQNARTAQGALVAVLAIAAFAVASGPASASPEKFSAKAPAAVNATALHGEQISQGVVQSVSAKAVVLKTLDGSTVSVPVDAKTRVLVNGKTALLREVKPGFVATAKWKPGRATQLLQALDPSRRTAGPERGKSADHLPS
jgi:hypothetical protein